MRAWSIHHLNDARTLVGSGATIQNEASLRRAVSTAYYAVFQAICDVCARRMVGDAATWEVFTPVFRSLEHRHVAQTLKQKPLTDTPDLERLGIAFAVLQQFREWAGYNPEPRPNMQATGSSQPFTREEALGLIDTASLAIDILDRLDDETRLRLAVRLVARSRK